MGQGNRRKKQVSRHLKIQMTEAGHQTQIKEKGKASWRQRPLHSVLKNGLESQWE